MDTNEYDEQNLFVVDFSQNIYDITGEQDDNSDNDDNIEEIRNEENFGGNRGRGRGQKRGQGWVNLPNDFLSPSPYLIFSLFFSLAQIEIIVKNTNKYAYVKDAGEGRQWKELTIKEDNKFPEHKISTFMSLIRFEQIKRFIHISDCTAPLPFWYSKVNPLATHIQTVSKSICVPSSNISVDEMIVRFSGRSIHTVRIKNKPTPEGYKILSLCDAGYTYSFIFTSRVQNQPEVQQVTELSKVGNEVYHLASQLPIENKSFNIYMDNYFSSIKLFKYLREKKIGAYGTVRKNSANFPQILKVDKKLDWDTLSGVVVDNVLAILWMDNSPVTMLSTIHQIDNGNENRIERIRRRPRETSTNAVKLQGYYGTQLPVRRTWMPLFFWLLDTALINSYLILKKINANVNHQKDFRMQLAWDLIKEDLEGNEKKPHTRSQVHELEKQFKLIHVDPNKEHQYVMAKFELPIERLSSEERSVHRTTVARHLLEEERAQTLKDEYQRLYLEENFYYSEVEYSYEENLCEEENERSFMETSDNDEENKRSYMEMSDSEDLEETDDDFGFENEENNNYENDSISDSQNESEFDNADNVNFNTDNEENSIIISDELLEGLRLLYVKSNFNFSEAAFNNIYKVFNRNKMSFNKIKKILGSIVGIEPKIYDMCVNSCCAFVGVLENERKCKFCKEDQYYNNGKSRKNLPFISIIERLKLQFKNSKRSEELLYRYNYTNNIGDLVHGDIGPKQPQDFNSFLYPLIQEMKMLQDGISCYDGNKKENFTLRAHILAWTGDLPALSKVLCLTGHNLYLGCRFCNLQGTLNEMNRHIYYPLQQGIDLKQLPIRTHNEMLISTNEIEHLKGDHRETHIRNCGCSKTWVEIGEIMEKNRSNMPSDIGRPSCNIVKHSAGFKVVEWANWIILFSLPLLKGRLPQSHFLGWSNFVEAVQLCIQPRIDLEDLDKI
ncbi:hypothetical protein RCL_jg90.t1 [Rhizophagus clarus]|uniref:PiggyBac transposable element-derived protein domain-containing protein n=1 Tax=Rhizophagus clarus TaxID=94130 RepID=A0A8H3L7F8_9GLOM|nr:hypothetical protein RCL_jg90.t1 [Rhizophagus clarus]